MTPSRRIVAVLHPGRMGAAIGQELTRRGVRVLWCSTDRSADTARRARATGLHEVRTLATLLPQASVVFSVCPPGAADTVANQVAEVGYSGLYVEANAISPERWKRISALLDQAGARVLDACVIGPPPVQAGTTRLYLAGAEADKKLVVSLFTDTRLDVVPMPATGGAASALKLSHTTYRKVSRALAAVAHSFARAHGVSEELAIEAERMGRPALADPEYLSSVAARAWRWLPELRDTADSLRHSGVPHTLPLAAAEVMERWVTHKDNFDVGLEEVLSDLRR